MSTYFNVLLVVHLGKKQPPSDRLDRSNLWFWVHYIHSEQRGGQASRVGGGIHQSIRNCPKGKAGQEQVNSLWHKGLQGESLKIVWTTHWNSQTTTSGLKASGENHRHQQGFKRGSFEKTMRRTSIGAFWPFPRCRPNTWTYNSRTPTPSGHVQWRLSKTSMIIPNLYPRKLSMS